MQLLWRLAFCSVWVFGSAAVMAVTVDRTSDRRSATPSTLAAQLPTGPYDLKRLGLGEAVTVVIFFGSECSACIESISFYRKLLALEGMDGRAGRLVIVARQGLVPVKLILDEHRLIPHGLTSGPGSNRTVEGIDLNKPPALILLDRDAGRLGTWNGRLTARQEREVFTIIGRELGGR